VEKEILEVREHFYAVIFSFIEKFRENPRNGNLFAGGGKSPT
jgi:hypothetical protein